MATYFGACNSGGAIFVSNPFVDDNNAAILIWNNASNPFTCPGSGNQTIKELSAYVYNAGKIRLAIYDSTGTTLIAQGAAAVTISGASESWQGHLSQASITPNPATLVGGTTYLLVYGQDATNDVKTSHANGGSTGYYNLVDKTTGGYSGALPTGSAGSYWPVRCGVDPATGSANWPTQGYWWDNPYFGRNR